METDLPPEAVPAALIAIHRATCPLTDDPDHDCTRAAKYLRPEVAIDALEAAAPAIRAQERERIGQLATRAGATYCPICITEPMPPHGGHPNWDHPFADLIGDADD